MWSITFSVRTRVSVPSQVCATSDGGEPEYSSHELSRPLVGQAPDVSSVSAKNGSMTCSARVRTGP